MEHIELLPTSYQAVCAICGAQCRAKEYPEDIKPFGTFTLGRDERTSFAAGVVSFCPLHIATGNALAVLSAWFTGRSKC